VFLRTKFILHEVSNYDSLLVELPRHIHPKYFWQIQSDGNCNNNRPALCQSICQIDCIAAPDAPDDTTLTATSIGTNPVTATYVGNTYQKLF